MPRFLVLCAALVSLCQCATKHQPIEFPPFFSVRPQSYFAPEHLVEIAELERTPALGLYGKKRLVDLYSLELKQLKPGTPRHQLLTDAAAAVAPEVQPQEEELRKLQAEISAYKEPPSTDERPAVVFESPAFKKEYFAAYGLWNKDQNEAALKKANEIFRNLAYQGKVGRGEWFKLLNLRFRISLDLQDLPSSITAYEDMKRADDCAPDTTQAGFLVALHRFSGGDVKGAADTFESQCDPDKSPSNRIKRLYWSARFEESNPSEAAKKYEEIVRSKVPGYYFYLAHWRLGRRIEFSPMAFRTRSYLGQSFEVDSGIHALLLSAEERLRHNLRRDAALFLIRAAQQLRKDATSGANLPALLYTAHLLQAAGSQLEAMKIYAVVTTALQDDDDDNHTIDFLGEMFPRPHGPTVDWLARQWDTDPDFIYSIMRQESAFNPGAVSVVDARGLMQLMPFLARNMAQQWSYSPYYTDKMLFHAHENLKLSVYHMHQLRLLAPHLALMAASYNAGLTRVSGWWKRNRSQPLDVFVELIPINETRNYVKLVLRNYIHYRALRGNGVVDIDVVPFELPVFPAFLG